MKAEIYTEQRLEFTRAPSPLSSWSSLGHEITEPLWPDSCLLDREAPIWWQWRIQFPEEGPFTTALYRPNRIFDLGGCEKHCRLPDWSERVGTDTVKYKVSQNILRLPDSCPASPPPVSTWGFDALTGVGLRSAFAPHTPASPLPATATVKPLLTIQQSRLPFLLRALLACPPCSSWGRAGSQKTVSWPIWLEEPDLLPTCCWLTASVCPELPLLLALRGALSSKAGVAPGEGLSGSGCVLLRDAVYFVTGLYASRLSPVHLYIPAKRLVCRSTAHLLFPCSASVPVGSFANEGSGGRLEDGKQEEASVCFLWHLPHSLRTHVTGLPGSSLECDPDSEGLSVPSSLLVPLAEGWWQLPAAANHYMISRSSVCSSVLPSPETNSLY